MIWFFLKLSAVFRKCLYFKKYTWRIIGWDFRITSVCPIFFLVLEFKITLILKTHLKTKDLNLIFNLSCIVGGPNFASANSRQGPFLIFKQNRCTCNNALAKNGPWRQLVGWPHGFGGVSLLFFSRISRNLVRGW